MGMEIYAQKNDESIFIAGSLDDTVKSMMSDWSVSKAKKTKEQTKKFIDSCTEVLHEEISLVLIDIMSVSGMIPTTIESVSEKKASILDGIETIKGLTMTLKGLSVLIDLIDDDFKMVVSQ